MKGFRFYLEHGSRRNKRNGVHEGNVFAVADVSGDDFRPIRNSSAQCGYVWEGYGSIYPHTNSAVCWCSTDVERIREECKRIPEWKARQIHPALFARLDEDMAREKETA